MPSYFTFRSPSEILAMQFPASDCILGDNLLSKGAPLTILGPPGIGKSRILFQIVGCNLKREPFFGMPTTGHDLRYLFIQTENSNRRLQKDFQHFKTWLGEEAWLRFDKQVLIHTLENEVDAFLTLSVESNRNELRSKIMDWRPNVVSWDPLNSYGAGDLNTDQAMIETLLRISQVTKSGDHTRATVILHHALTGKAGASKAVGFERGGFGRNSKALQAWTRAAINIAPGAADDPTKLVISCGKNSDGEEFEPFAVQLNKETMIYEFNEDFDMEEWVKEVNGSAKSKTKDHTAMAKALCVSPMDKKQLSTRLELALGKSQSTAYRVLDKAVINGCLCMDKKTGLYTRPDDTQNE